MPNTKIRSQAKLAKILKEKGDSISVEDFLISELEWLIDSTSLSDKERRFAEYRYIRRLKATDVMEQMGWYSTNTFTRHNKTVWAKIVHTARIVILNED